MNKSYDLICIGGGSGGVATAIKAAQQGARCAVIESRLLGGTCVNVGCVPKKIHWLASQTAMYLKDAAAFGFAPVTLRLDWPTLVQKRQAYIEKQQQGYAQRLRKYQIDLIHGQAHFNSPTQIQVDDQILSAPHIVIASGSHSTWPNIPGSEYGIDSDGFFALKKLPHRVVVVGAGYIAVELVGILHAMGCETTLAFRHDSVLREFDTMLSQHLLSIYQQQGIILKPQHVPTALKKEAQGKLHLSFANQPTLTDIDAVIWAIGREPQVKELKLDGLQLNEHGAIAVDAFQNTSISGIYALGDVTAQKALTPVAIAAGRHLALRLFAQKADSKLNYDTIPSVIFSHPPIGTVGLTELQAQQKYGTDLRIFETEFTPMSQALFEKPARTRMKLITVASSDKVVGCHIIGDGADEMLQGFALAIHMGATKQDFDNIVAIHPTSAEELVTLTTARSASSV